MADIWNPEKIEFALSDGKTMRKTFFPGYYIQCLVKESGLWMDLTINPENSKKDAVHHIESCIEFYFGHEVFIGFRLVKRTLYFDKFISNEVESYAMRIVDVVEDHTMPFDEE